MTLSRRTAIPDATALPLGSLRPIVRIVPAGQAFRVMNPAICPLTAS